MAAATKLLGRIGSVLNGGSAAKGSGCALRGLMDQAAHIPKGYALTSTGVLIPDSAGLKGFDLGVRKIEEIVLDKMEKTAGLIYRFTKVIVGTAACGVAVKLTWHEVTDAGHIQSYLSAAGGQEQSIALGYKTKKMIVEEVNQSMVFKYNNIWKESSVMGISFVSIATEVVLMEQRNMLKDKGFCNQDLVEAEVDLLMLLNAATAERSKLGDKAQAKAKDAEPSEPAEPEGLKPSASPSSESTTA